MTDFCAQAVSKKKIVGVKLLRLKDLARLGVWRIFWGGYVKNRTSEGYVKITEILGGGTKILVGMEKNTFYQCCHS